MEADSRIAELSVSLSRLKDEVSRLRAQLPTAGAELSLPKRQLSPVQADSETPNYYVAGQRNGEALTTGAPGLNTIRLLPMRVADIGNLVEAAFFVTGGIAAGDGVAKIVAYSNARDGHVYPGTLLFQSETFAITGPGKKAALLQVGPKPGSLIWVGHWAGTHAVTIRCLTVSGTAPILGLNDSFDATPILGWSLSAPFGEAPEVFPRGASPLVSGPIPAVGVRFGA